MLNIKSLLTKIVSEGIFPSGGQKTSNTIYTTPLSQAIAASGQISATTVDGMIIELGNSSGSSMGSVNITTTYTSGGITIPTGWYNYLYFGTNLNTLWKIRIFLFGMTVSQRNYIIDYNTDHTPTTIVHEIQSTNMITKSNMSNGTTTYYSLNGAAGTHYYYVKKGNIVTVNFNVKCTSPSSSWATFASGLPTHNHQLPIYFALGCESSGVRPIWARINNNGTIAAMGGTANRYFYGSISYITNNG